MSRTWCGRRSVRSLVTALVVSALASTLMAACGNAPLSVVTHAGDADGVTDTTITVGSLASMSGFASSDFAPVVTGAAIYFDRLNAAGGVDGRKIDYRPNLDDGTSPTGDTSGAQQLVQDKVFAVVGVGTPFFNGSSVLQAHAVPTFGLQENTNAQWAGPTMFGVGGSYVDFTTPMPQAVYVLQQNHDKRAAVLAYNVAQSSQGCISVINALRASHIDTPVIDESIPYAPTSLDADVVRMQQQGVDFVTSCMDATGDIKLSQTLQQHGMGSVTQYWLDGYDQQTLDNNAAAMRDVYFLLQQTPFEETVLHPGRYPGIDAFNAALAKYAPRGTLPSTPALAGWVSADLFVTGLRAIGTDVTRTRLVAALNKLTTYTADGAIPPVDWTKSHTGTTALDCTAFVQARRTSFVPVYGTKPSVYTCFGRRPHPSGLVDVLPLQPAVPGQ
ncbi:MAG: ABC transporter substrate-binding protein [Acidimicrobiales bacterium]